MTEFSGKINTKAIIGGAIIAIAANHILMTGLRGIGFTNNASALFNQRFSYYIARLVVAAISFFVAGFAGSYLARAKTASAGVVNALVSMSVFHIVGNLIIPLSIVPENAAIANSLFYLANFFMELIGILTGLYGGSLAVKSVMRSHESHDVHRDVHRHEHYQKEVRV